MTGKKHEHIVKSIMPGSIAEELGIEPGDKLRSTVRRLKIFLIISFTWKTKKSYF